MNLGFAKSLDRVLGSLAGRVIGWGDGVREWARPPGPLPTVERVLVVKFWGLGNWALLRPIVRDLATRWPGARITVATLEANHELVADLADEVLLVRPHSLATVATDLLRAVAALRRCPPDLAVDFEQFARAGALLARLGGARQRVGFRAGAPGRDGLYTVQVPFRRDVHVSRSFRDLAEAAGVPAGPYVPGALAASETGRAEIAQHLPSRPFVVLHPGSGDNFPGRRWSAAGFAAAGRQAVRRGRQVVVTGGQAEGELAARVARSVGAEAVSLAGRLSVGGFVALLSRADAILSNDTGPVHLGSALGVPVLAVFGPNTPVLYGPLAEGSRAFYRALPCSPCLTTTNYRTSRCRIHTCTASIPAGEVASALARLLEPAHERSTRWPGPSF